METVEDDSGHGLSGDVVSGVWLERLEDEIQQGMKSFSVQLILVAYLQQMVSGYLQSWVVGGETGNKC